MWTGRRWRFSRPTILHDTGLSAGAYGDVGSAFQFAYMIANPLWGSILDFVGLRRGMLAAVAIWTVASVSHAWVGGFWGFAVVRTLLGLGEGAAFPGGFRAASESLPPDRQGRGTALAYSGASLGAMITPLLVIPHGGALPDGGRRFSSSRSLRSGLAGFVASR